MKSIIRSITVFTILVACNGLYGMFSQAYRAVRTGTRAATTAAGETSAITPKTSSSASNGPEEEVAQRRVYANQAKSTSAAQSESGSKAEVFQQGSAAQGQRTTQIKNPGYSGSYLANMPKKKHVPGAGLTLGDIKNWVFSKLGLETAQETEAQPQTIVQQRAPRNPGLQPRPLIQPGFQRRYYQPSEGPAETAGAPMNPPAPGFFALLTMPADKKAVETAFNAMVKKIDEAWETRILEWGTRAVFLTKDLVDEYAKAISNMKEPYNIINRFVKKNAKDSTPETLLYWTTSLTALFWQGRSDARDPEHRKNEYRAEIIQQLYSLGARLTDQEKRYLLENVQYRIKEFRTFTALVDFQSYAKLFILLHDIGIDVESVGIDLNKARLFSQKDLGDLGTYSLHAFRDLKAFNEKREQERKLAQELKEGQSMSLRFSMRSIGKNDIPGQLEKQALELADLIFIPETQK